jgi:hypothetical protein
MTGQAPIAALILPGKAEGIEQRHADDEARSLEPASLHLR